MTQKLIDSIERAALKKPAFAGPWLPPIAILTVLAALLAYTFHVILTGGQYQLPGIDATIHYSWEVFTRRALAAGQLPYWNPYFFTGMPHVADVQTIVFYPPAVLLRWLEPGAFLSWQAVSHMWIGGAGTLFLGRIIGISWWASAAAALAVTLGGTNAARLHNGHLLVINGTAWLPWALALSIETVRRGRLAPSPALVLVMMLQFLSGYPQGSLYISAVVCFYFLFSVGWPDSGGSRSNRWRPLAQVLVLSLVALGLSAFQLLPTLGLAAQADRTRGIPFDQASAGAWALADTATFLWPFSGIEVQPAVRFIADRVAYAGWLLTCVGPFALLGKNRRRSAAFCLLLVGLAVAFTLADLPLYRLHHAVFPGLREPGRILFIATLGVAVLGGLGLDALVEYAQRRQWRRLMLPGVVSMTAVCSAVFVALTHWKTAAVAPVHGWPWIPVVAAVALLVTMIAARAGAVRTALTVALLACAIDVTAYSQGGAHAVGIESDATMRRWVGPSSGGRALSLCENRVYAQDLLMTGVPALRGPVGVRLADYIEWLTLLESTAWPGDTIGERAIRRDLVDSANVSTIISCESISAPFLKLVSHTHPVFVYHNTAAWPRAIGACEVEELDRAAVRSRLVGGRYDDAGSLWPIITVQWAAGLHVDKRAELERRYRLFDVGSDGTALQYLLRDVSPANVLGLVRHPAVAETSGIDHLTGANTTRRGSGDGGGAREVLVTRTHCPDSGVIVIGGQDRPDGAVRADVEAPRAGWVFLSEPDYRERFAFVDGQRVALRKANLAFVAIPVPAGRHVVELRYVPTLFHRGIGITAATVAAWGGVLAFGRMRRSRVHTAT
jgi:hypothetical protein